MCAGVYTSKVSVERMKTRQLSCAPALCLTPTLLERGRLVTHSGSPVASLLTSFTHAKQPLRIHKPSTSYKVTINPVI